MPVAVPEGTDIVVHQILDELTLFLVAGIT